MHSAFCACAVVFSIVCICDGGGYSKPLLGRVPPLPFRTTGMWCPLGRTWLIVRALPSFALTRHRAVKQGRSRGSVGTTYQGKSRESEVGIMCNNNIIIQQSMSPINPVWHVKSFQTRVLVAAV